MVDSSKKEVKVLGFREEEEKGVVLITPWSAIHFLSGVAMKNLGVDFWWASAIHGIYELKDMYAREVGVEYNSSLNSVSDQLIAMAGHHFGTKDANLPGLWLWGGAFIFATILEDTSAGDYLA